MSEIVAKTFSELKKSFETHTLSNNEVDNADLAIWLNEAALDLALDCRLPQLPSPFNGDEGDQVCDLPILLHDLLPLFAAARYWDRESEGDNEESMHGNKWMAYYLQGKNLRRAMLSFNESEPQNWQIE